MENGIPQKPLFSVIIPVRNEEFYLPKCLDALQIAAQQLPGKVETIIVLNRSTDRSEEIARARGCLTVKDESKNLAAIRNAGAKHASGDYLVTVDADSLVSPNLFVVVHKKLSSGKYIGGGVMMYLERYSLGIIVTMLCLVPIALRYRIFCGVFFCRTADFHAIGGFNQNMVSVEDIDFAVRLKKFGKKCGKKFSLLFHAYIITSARKFDRFGDWYLLRNPKEFITLLRGKDQELANKYWYDFER